MVGCFGVFWGVLGFGGVGCGARGGSTLVFADNFMYIMLLLHEVEVEAEAEAEVGVEASRELVGICCIVFPSMAVPSFCSRWVTERERGWGFLVLWGHDDLR